MIKKSTLNTEISVEDFRNYYWNKNELIDFCRLLNLDKRGGKIELTHRIEKYLVSGEREPYKEKVLRTSRFEWNTELLSPETIITDSYKNTGNVRAFFKSQIREKFRFNVKFMDWMKSAQGKTLGNAVEKWISIKNELIAYFLWRQEREKR